MTAGAPPPIRRGAALSHFAYWIATTAVVAGLTHLATILLLPRHSPDDAFARLSRIAAESPQGPVRAAPAGSLPEQDPAMAIAFCLYDLGKGPVTVGLDVADATFAALSVYSRHGQVLYGLTSRSASRNQLRLTLVPRDATATTPKESGEVRVESPEVEGIVLAQALATAPSAMAQAQALVSRLACGAGAAHVAAKP